MKRDGVLQPTKYSWIELDLEPVRNSKDFRPESYTPRHKDFRDLVVGEHIKTVRNWRFRKDWCLKDVWTNMTDLIEASKDPNFKSLVTFKPAKIHRLEVEETDEDWNSVYAELDKQLDIFSMDKEGGAKIRKRVKKVPYKFCYRFEDETGRISRMMIEDWEVGMLYWKALERANGNREIAVKKVVQRYQDIFLAKNDIYLFLGTTKKFHAKNAPNPFTMIGVFYPLKESQGSLF